MAISQSKSIWALFEDSQLWASMMHFLPDHVSVAMSDFFHLASLICPVGDGIQASVFDPDSISRSQRGSF